MSFDVLQEKIIAKQNPTVAGLDARIEYVPEHIRKAAFAQHGVGLKGACEAIWQFNVGLIDALCDVVPAVKPQSAYYENLGWQGMEMLERTIRYAKEKGLFVIADIKRGDIGSTAAAYAEGWLSGAPIEGQVFKSFDADCVTLNGYIGTEGQYGFTMAGAVTGATYPEQIQDLRARLPHTFFLVPGYGAQGGTAEDVKYAFNEKGHGAIVNSSRGIMCAWKKTGGDGHDFQEAARNAAIAMKEDIARFVTIQ